MISPLTEWITFKPSLVLELLEPFLIKALCRCMLRDRNHQHRTPCPSSLSIATISVKEEVGPERLHR